jgi:undecaprenyl-diphosphatase
MSVVDALVLAILQGITELFPVSSLGHAVVLPALLGWRVDERAPDFLPFLVALHLGTVAALLVYFWRDWIEILVALIGRGAGETPRKTRRLFWFLVVATIPAVMVGFAFEKRLQHLFGAPVVAAAFLVVNGLVLYVGERLRRRAGDGAIDSLNWKAAAAIGACQCAALIPGISRSGATMVGGLFAGLRHADAARFSFLLATPIILGAAVLEVPKLLHREAGAAGLSEMAILAGAIAGLTAYASIALLMRYFRRHEFEALDPFAYYCWAAGAAALVVLVAFA